MANALVARLSARERPTVPLGRRIARSWYTLIQGPYTSALMYPDEVGGSSGSPVRVSQDCALSIAAVYRALAVYADLIGTLPVRRYQGDERRLPLPAFVDHPAGAEVGWTDEIGMILWSLLLRGNAYAVPTSHDAQGYPTGFVVLNPDLIEAKRVDGLGPQYRYRTARGELVWTKPGPVEFLHIRWQTPPGSLTGVGILDANAYPGGTLAGAWAANYFSGDVMSNPSPPAVITHPQRLNAEQALDLQQQWATSVGRSRSVPAVLSGGITYAPLALNARDAQLLETRKWNATEIATMFGLPPYIVGGSTGDSLTYATVEGEMIRLWTTALMPMTVRLERSLSAWLPHGQRLKFVPDALLRSQTLDRYNAHKIALDAGFATVAEIRALEDLPTTGAPAPDPPAPADDDPEVDPE